MKKNNHRDDIYLKHILDSAKNIKTFMAHLDKESFKKNILIQSAVIRQLEIIGEAVKHISLNLKQSYSEIKWKEIAGTRDKLIHDYMGVDIDLVWTICKKDIENLKRKISQILKDFKYC